MRLYSIQKPVIPYTLLQILRYKKGTKGIYDVLNLNSEQPTGQIRWNTINEIDAKEWKNPYKLPQNCTQENYLKSQVPI